MKVWEPVKESISTISTILQEGNNVEIYSFQALANWRYQVMFQHPDGWQSTTGVVGSESDWRAIGWVMEDKSQKHNKED